MPGNTPTKRERLRREHLELQRLAKEEHGCISCGEQDVTVLEFNHVEPPGEGNKRTMARIISAGLCRSIFLRELRKCVVLCANCHRRVTGGYLSILPHAPRAGATFNDSSGHVNQWAMAGEALGT